MHNKFLALLCTNELARHEYVRRMTKIGNIVGPMPRETLDEGLMRAAAFYRLYVKMEEEIMEQFEPLGFL